MFVKDSVVFALFGFVECEEAAKVFQLVVELALQIFPTAYRPQPTNKVTSFRALMTVYDLEGEGFGFFPAGAGSVPTSFLAGSCPWSRVVHATQARVERPGLPDLPLPTDPWSPVGRGFGLEASLPACLAFLAHLPFGGD